MRCLRELMLRAEDFSILIWRRTPLQLLRRTDGALTASEAPNASDNAEPEC